MDKFNICSESITLGFSNIADSFYWLWKSRSVNRWQEQRNQALWITCTHIRPSLHLVLPCASYLDCNAMLIQCDRIEIGCIYTWLSLCSSAISDYRNRMLMQVYRRPCWLTDEDVHGCGQLASTLRVTGREAGTSSRHRPLGNLSERKRVQQKDEWLHWTF